MKKLIRLIALTLCSVTIIASLSACSFFDSSSNRTTTQNITFTVTYYENKTMQYSGSSNGSVQTDFIAPSGQIIKGLFDENNIQYADCDCIVALKGKTIPTMLYAKYEPVDNSYYQNNPITFWDEAPRNNFNYTGITNTITFNKSNSNDKKFIATCLCNPYSDLTISVSFLGKGHPKYIYDNPSKFFSRLFVYNEEVAEFRQTDLGDSYTKHNYSAKIKAKQLINSDYTIKIETDCEYAYTGYYVKNYKISFQFDFSANS